MINELARTPTFEISGWNYVEQNMPLLRDHLITCATNEGLSLPVFIGTKVPKGGLAPLIITYQKADSSDYEPRTKQKIDLQCDQVELEELQKYVDGLRFFGRQKSFTGSTGCGLPFTNFSAHSRRPAHRIPDGKFATSESR